MPRTGESSKFMLLNGFLTYRKKFSISKYPELIINVSNFMIV